MPAPTMTPPRQGTASLTLLDANGAGVANGSATVQVTDVTASDTGVITLQPTNAPQVASTNVYQYQIPMAYFTSKSKILVTMLGYDNAGNEICMNQKLWIDSVLS